MKLGRPPKLILRKCLLFHLSMCRGKATSLINKVMVCYRALERVHEVQVSDTITRPWVNRIFKDVLESYIKSRDL